MRPDAAPAATSIAEQIRRTVAAGDLTLPPMPEVVMRVQALLRDDDADTHVLGDLLSTEPALTAAVLRVANSATYGGLSAIGSLPDAIARVGMLQVGNTVTAVAHKGHFTSQIPARRELLHLLWRHAVATAAGARRLVGSGGGSDSEAFLAGLLHDVGKLVVLKGLERVEAGLPAPLTGAVVNELMGLLHPELGHAVLTRWKIPPPVCDVARRHHEAEVAETELLLIRVQAANRIARKIGAHPEPQPDADLMLAPEIERLGMSELEVAALAVDVEDELTRVLQAL